MKQFRKSPAEGVDVVELLSLTHYLVDLVGGHVDAVPVRVTLVDNENGDDGNVVLPEELLGQAAGAVGDDRDFPHCDAPPERTPDTGALSYQERFGFANVGFAGI